MLSEWIAVCTFSILRRTALSMLKEEKTVRLGIKNNRLQAGWDESYLVNVLPGQQLMVQSPC
jgi:hypothetical protein